jgi:DNA-directed RNA polymerase
MRETKRRSEQAMASGQMQPHVNAVNALQRVAWTINTDVLELLQKLRSTPEGCALLRKVKHASGWAVFDTLDLPMAKSLVGKTFWLKYNIDWRGRAYPLPFFNYSRADHIRALFRFAEGERIGTWGLVWLKAAVAKHFGERTSLHERVAWTDERLDRIRAVAANPMAHLQWLQEAKSPMQFFAAAAYELAQALDVGPDFLTHLPIGLDASCSGAQHYSLLSRSVEGARLTNLIADGDFDRVECLYLHVLNRVKTQTAAADLAVKAAAAAGQPLELGDESGDALAAWWCERLDRDLFKSMVMISMYGAKRFGLREAVRDWLDDNGYAKHTRPGDNREHVPEGAIAYLVDVAERTLKSEQCVAPAIRNWLRKIARVMGNRGKAVTWITPTGLPVSNLYRLARTKTMKVWLGDKSRRHVVAYGYGAFCTEKAVNAVAPNFVHSLDAAHMVAVANRCADAEIDLACVHDCFAVLAPYAAMLHDLILLGELYKLYADNDPLAQKRENAAKVLGSDANLEPVPERGDLDLTQILGACHAFS